MIAIPSVGIIGAGFVGASTVKGFQHYTDTKCYDMVPERSNSTYEETIEQDIIFVCVNTPMNLDGTVDGTLVESVLAQLQGNLPEGHQNKPVIIKSTLPPETIGQFMLEYTDLFIIYSPEFLTERTAEYDFNQSSRIIMGVLDGEVQKEHFSEPMTQVERLMKFRFPQVPIIWCRFEEASLVKYFTNVFFSVKISLMNEFAQVAEAYELSPDEVIGKVMLDQRIGRSHFKVPGHDGKKGFGGHCFPKDLNGYIHIARNLGISPRVGQAAWEKNLEVRPEQDWRADIGRAVNFEEDDEE